MSRAVYMCNDKGLTLPGCNECDDLQSQIDHLKTEVAGKMSSDELIAGDRIQIDVGENGVTISSGLTKEDILSLLGYREIQLSKTDSEGIRTTVEVLGKITTETFDPPTFTGVNDLTIETNSTFDPHDGVHAHDYNGTSLTYTVTGTVDTSTAGDYTLTYTATDDLGLTTTATRTITVIGTHTTTVLFSDWYGCGDTGYITQEEYDRVYNAVGANTTVTAVVANDEELQDIVWEGNLPISDTWHGTSEVYKRADGITFNIRGIDGDGGGSFDYTSDLEVTICFGNEWFFHIEAIGG